MRKLEPMPRKPSQSTLATLGLALIYALMGFLAGCCVMAVHESTSIVKVRAYYQASQAQVQSDAAQHCDSRMAALAQRCRCVAEVKGLPNE